MENWCHHRDCAGAMFSPAWQWRKSRTLWRRFMVALARAPAPMPALWAKKCPYDWAFLSNAHRRTWFSARTQVCQPVCFVFGKVSSWYSTSCPLTSSVAAFVGSISFGAVIEFLHSIGGRRERPFFNPSLINGKVIFNFAKFRNFLGTSLLTNWELIAVLKK